MKSGAKHNLARARRGFTLLEMAIVTMVMGILAAAAIPALRSVDDTNAAGARSEIERQVVLARSCAFASGIPHGIHFDVSKSSFQQMQIESAGQAPAASRDALGNPTPEIVLSSRFAGAAITAFVNGDSSTGTGTLWFGYDGAPQIRNSNGALAGTFVSTAVVSLSGGFVVRISTAGAIDR